MTSPPPRVSIVIPSYNRVGFVGAAIDSCLASNSPSFPVEVIVVDDGSTDGTEIALRAYEGRIRYLPLATNHGRNGARNFGLAAATGRYVKFLDSDDVLEPGSLPIEVATAAAADAEIAISGWKSVEVEPGKPPRLVRQFEPPTMEPIIDSLLAGKAVPTGAALYSRELVRDLRWDEHLHELDDWDWFIRAAMRARKIARANCVAYSWIGHPDQSTRSYTMVRNALGHHAILRKFEGALADAGELTPARKKRLAQYYYKELRVLCLHDAAAFERGVRHLYELDPSFIPRDEERQLWMRLACRALGVRTALSAHSSIKQWAGRHRRAD